MAELNKDIVACFCLLYDRLPKAILTKCSCAGAVFGFIYHRYAAIPKIYEGHTPAGFRKSLVSLDGHGRVACHENFYFPFFRKGKRSYNYQ
jgi:hypothetical protein